MMATRRTDVDMSSSGWDFRSPITSVYGQTATAPHPAEGEPLGWCVLLVKQFIDKRDTVADVQRKKVVLWTMLTAGMVLGFIPLVIGVLKQTFSSAGEWAVCTASTCLAVGSLAWMYFTKSMSQGAFVVVVVIMMFIVMATDLDAMSIGAERRYPFFVIVLDLALLGKIQRSRMYVLLVPMLLWSVVTSIEGNVRFGLLDLFWLPSGSSREELCSCDKLPCAVSPYQTIRNFFSVVLICLLDFFITQRFASRAAEEQENMRAVVQAVQEIATSLALFDLDAADSQLRVAHGLSEDMRIALCTLLENLHAFRPYLPRVLFAKLGASRAVSSMESSHVVGIQTGACEVRSSTRRVFLVVVRVEEADDHHPTAASFEGVFNAALKRFDAKSMPLDNDVCIVDFSDPVRAVEFSRELVVWGTASAAGGVVPVSVAIHAWTVGEDEVPEQPCTGAAINQLIALLGTGFASTITISRDVFQVVEKSIENMRIMHHGPDADKSGYSHLKPIALIPMELDSCCQAVAERLVPHVADGCVPPVRGVSTEDVAARSNTRVIGTLCVMALPVPWENLCMQLADRLEVVEETLRATGGLMIALLNTHILASWGCFTPCDSTRRQAMRFLGRVTVALGGLPTESAAPPMRCGLVTGPVVCDRVRVSQETLYIMTLGPCVDMALALCAGAAQLGTQALTATLSSWPGDLHACDNVLGPNMRPVDRWRLRKNLDYTHVRDADASEITINGPAEPRSREGEGQGLGTCELHILDDLDQIATVLIYELRVGKLLETERAVQEAMRAEALQRVARPDLDASPVLQSGSDDVSLPPPPPPAPEGPWGAAYREAYNTRDIKRLRQWAEDDPVVGRVCEMLETHTHLEHSTVQV